MLLAVQDCRQVLQLFGDVQLAERADIEVVHDRSAVVVAVAGRVQRLHLRGMPGADPPLLSYQLSGLSTCWGAGCMCMQSRARSGRASFSMCKHAQDPASHLGCTVVHMGRTL